MSWPPMIPPVLPIVQIRQTPALIGIDADLGKQSIEQPRPTYEMQYQRPQQDIKQPRGELTINQKKAFDAVALGNNLEVMHRIYSQARNIALETVAKIAQEGDRLAAIHTGEDAIAANAQDIRISNGEFTVIAGPASFLNVEMRYEARKPIINVQDGKVHVNARVNKPEHHYDRGKLDIYMRQYNKVEFTPPQIDIQM